MELITRNYKEFSFFFTNTLLTVYSQILTVIILSIFGIIFDYANNPGIICFVIIIYVILLTLFFLKDFD